jgi:hypothetical protein
MAAERGSLPSVSLLSEEDILCLYVHHRAIREYDFIQRWVRYGKERTDAPQVFHQMAAIALVATATDRNVWLDLQHQRVYPGVYLIAIAPSGQRKSTPLTYATTAAMSALADRLLANDFSAEALIADLARRGGVSRGLAVVDEAGRLLGTMRRSQYGEGLKDLLSHLWSAPDEYNRHLMKGDYQLQSVFLNLVMATTLSRFPEVVEANDIGTGFLARFLPFLARGEIVRKPLSALNQDTWVIEQGLIADLATLRDKLKGQAGPMSIHPNALMRLDEAEQRLTAWATAEFHTELIEPWARRLSEYAQRLSVIFAVSEGIDQVELPQVLRALRVIDRAKEDVVTIVEELTKGTFARALDKVERFVRNNPGLSLRDLYRRASLSAKGARELVDELVTQGRIVSRGDWYFAIVTPDTNSAG